MSLRFRHAAAALAILAAGLAPGIRGLAADEAHKKEVEQWRAKHEADYRREYVALAGLSFLKPGENRAGSAASNDIVLGASTPPSLGTFVADGGPVRFRPAPGVAVRIKDRRLTAEVDLRSDGDEEGPDELLVGGIRLWVHNSGERRAIRVWDDQGEVARTFSGFRWFPIDERYRVTARFIKDPAPREVRIPNILGDDEMYTTEGMVEFTLNGQKIRMRPMTTRPNRFFFIFKDATSGKETYAAARFLYSDLRDDGTTVLDFNQAYNPPCAFNPYTTCPLPPPENRLTVRIEAGEKDYAHPLAHPSIP